MKRIIHIVLILLVGCSLYAQKFTASVNKNNVSVGEVFQLDLIVNTNAREFTPPAFNDFTVYSGPNQSSSVQIINGSMSQSITLSYFLAATKEGTLTIGPASIIAGNTTLQSNPITIQVGKGSSSAQQPQAQNQSTQGNTKSGTQRSNDNLFVRTSVSKSKVFTNEQIKITHKVYTRLNLKGFQDIKFPSYNGFWVQDIATNNSQYQITNEVVDGIQYNVIEIKKAYLFPQRSGKIEIEPIEVQCVVREKTGKHNDPFEQFFGSNPFFGMDNYKDVIYNIKSNPVSIDVTPLPEANKPTDFSGAVGTFNINASIDQDNVKTNEGINLKVTITGKGNIKLIDVPKMSFPDGIENYDPKTSESITTTDNGVSGSKTFEYLLIPRREGIYQIQPGDFHYFDPEKKVYVVLPSKEFTVKVEKGTGNAANNTAMMSGVTKEDVKMVGNDIRFIKTNTAPLMQEKKYFFGSPLFVIGFFVPPILFFAFLFFRSEHIKRNSDLVFVKRKGANRIAKKHLSQAEKSMASNNKEIFFENILSALYEYAGNKLNIPTATLTKENVVQELKAKNVPGGITSDFTKLIGECEFARYAPGLQSGDLQEVYNRVEKIITQIEDVIS